MERDLPVREQEQDAASDRAAAAASSRIPAQAGDRALDAAPARAGVKVKAPDAVRGAAKAAGKAADAEQTLKWKADELGQDV